MLRLVVKQAWHRAGRLALTVAAVAVGVAFVVGTLVLTDTSNRAFENQFADATSGVDVTVRDAAAFDSAMGVEVERDPLPGRALESIRRVEGVAEAQPMAKGSGLLVVRGEAVVPRGPSMLSTFADEDLTGFSLEEGRPPGPGEVAVDLATARAHDIHIGAPITVQSNRSRELRVSGTVRFGDEAGLPNTTVALVALPEAQQLLELGDGVTEVLVVSEQGTDADALRESVAAALGDGYDVTSGRDTARSSAEAAQDQLAYVQVTLLVLAGASLVVGGFLIANTFGIVVAQRNRELALLRAAGATGRQVRWSVLGEAGVVGAVGSAVGVAAGVLTARGLRQLAGSLGVALPDSALVVQARTLGLGLAIGVGVTVLAAMASARRAARTAPIEAMRTGDAGSMSPGRRTQGGVVAAGLAGALTAAGLAGGPAPSVVLGGLVALVALVLLGPALAPVAARSLGRPLRTLGVPGILAAQSAARAPRRTAATVTALALSLGLISFTGVLAHSIKGSVGSTYTEVIAADLVVESARGEMLGGLVAGVHHELTDLPEVKTVSRLRYGHWKDGSTTRALTAVDPATLGEVTRLTFEQGRLQDLRDGGILLGAKVAREKGLEVGDRLTMTFAKLGERRLRVDGIVGDTVAQALSTDYLVSLDTYATLFSERMDATLMISVAENATVAQAERAVELALEDFPTAEVRDQRAAVEGRTATIDQVFGLVTVLLMFTVVIALLGITNTLALSILERTREIGLLRAVGMARRQASRMVRLEAVLVAAMALLAGVAIGLGLAGAAVAVLRRSAVVTYDVPTGQMALVLLLATLGGLMAGVLPGRRAARIEVLEAVRQ